MDTNYPLRYPGPRWELRYGAFQGVEETAVTELQRQIQAYLPYVLPVRSSENRQFSREENLLLIGTAESNPCIAELVSRDLIHIPEKAESYHLACLDAPWERKERLIVVAGRDAKGVLNGVHAFGAQILSSATKPDREQFLRDQDLFPRDAIDKLARFSIYEQPAIEERGLWTWGNVLYDYRGYLDNMAKLRMNMLVLWNDCPPANINSFLAYAHDRGIKVIMGFHWGWGLESQLSLANPDHLEIIKENVVKEYETHYAHLDIDGIYFQTMTEHGTLEQGGKSTAALACNWVNGIAREMLNRYPNLRIIFGLHAISIREHYTDLAALDQRVSIMWEDAGVLPYSYVPSIGREDGADFEDTLAYSRQLVTFRPGTPFELVPKGFMQMRWNIESEHHEDFLIGERTPTFIKRRFLERQPLWDQVNAEWFKVYPYGLRFYREILDCKPARVTAVALVEDALFEARIQPSVALFAETLWNPCRNDAEVLRAVLSPYYQ